MKRNAMLYAINWRTGKTSLIPVNLEQYSNKKIRFKDFQILEDWNEVLIYVDVLVKKKVRNVFVVQLNDEGKAENSFNLTKDLEANILSVSASKLGDDEYIFTGTYSNNGFATSQGLYFARTADEKVEAIEYYGYADMSKTFLNYLPKKKQAKIEKKKKKREAKGKSVTFNYRLASHPLIELMSGEYLYLG